MKLFILILALALTVSASTKKHKVKWNPVLKGSHESMLRQNEEINRLQLPRIVDDDQLLELERTAELVPIFSSEALSINAKLRAQNKYCRPWTRQFIDDISRAYYIAFHQPLIVTSAVRTVEQQRRLTMTNRAAAPADGETTSSHLAGISVDIAKRWMSHKQHRWVEDYLKDLRDKGLIEVAEEKSQACFHIAVLNDYQVKMLAAEK